MRSAVRCGVWRIDFTNSMEAYRPSLDGTDAVFLVGYIVD